jgi:hypothetical protein
MFLKLSYHIEEVVEELSARLRVDGPRGFGERFRILFFQGLDAIVRM